MDEALDFIRFYTQGNDLDIALAEFDGLESVYRLLEKADRQRRWKIDEITQGVYGALRLAFKGS